MEERKNFKKITTKPIHIVQVYIYITEWSKSEREKQIPYADTYIWNPIKKKVSEELRGRTGIKTQT